MPVPFILKSKRMLAMFMPVTAVPKSKKVAMAKMWTFEIRLCSDEQRIETKE